MCMQLQALCASITPPDPVRNRPTTLDPLAKNDRPDLPRDPPGDRDQEKQKTSVCKVGYWVWVGQRVLPGTLNGPVFGDPWLWRQLMWLQL